MNSKLFQHDMAERAAVREAERAAAAAAVAVASYNGGKHVGVSVGGRFVLSLPPRLNGYRIPDLDEAADILRGESVEESDGWRNRAHDLHELARTICNDTVAALPGSRAGCAMTVTGDGTTRGVKYVMWCGRSVHTVYAVATSPRRLMEHWRGFVENHAAAEQRRALDAEQARADAARVLCGEALPTVQAVAVPVEHIEAAPAPDDDDHPEGVTNSYTCYRCGHEWDDVWNCEVDDDCPECGARHCTPHTSTPTNDE
jgi:DNA-directed RNA polymerase subunit RPC12/RpoP